ncbi:MAG: radical SAM protein [Nanoarchaeota archaeon]|nr:radical SAM protein [Nanoarchaeota archaeon]
MHVLFVNLPKIRNKYVTVFGMIDYSATPTFLLMLAKQEADKGNKISFVDLQINPNAKIPSADKLVTIFYTGCYKEHKKIFDEMLVNQGENIKKETYLYPLEKIFLKEKVPRAMFELIDVTKYSVIDTYLSLYCPNKCTFCVKTMSQNPVIYKDMNDYLEEIKYLESKNIKKVSFSDPEFTINRKRVLEFTENYKKNNFNVQYEITTRADYLDEEIIKALKKTNCYQVDIGIERASDRELAKIRKNMTYKKIKQTLKFLKKYKVRAGGFFIFGFPDDNHKTYERMKKKILELDLNTGRVNYFTPYPNTDVWQECVQHDLIDKNLKKETDTFSHQEFAICGTRYLTKEQVNKYVEKLNNILIISTKLPKLKFLVKSKTISKIISHLIQKIAILTKKLRR